MAAERFSHRRARTPAAGLRRITGRPPRRSAVSPHHASEAGTLSGGERLAKLAADNGLPVAEFLREVAELRLALATDLTIAAAAAEAGASQIAAAIVSGDRETVAGFHDRVHHLLLTPGAAEPAPNPPVEPAQPSRRGILRPAPLLATAASVVLLLGGLVGGPHFAEPLQPPNQLTLDAQARYLTFSNLVDSDAPAAQVIAASTELHDSLASLISWDPTLVVTLLNNEQMLVLSSDPAGTTTVLADVAALVLRLRATAPAGAVAALAKVVTAAAAAPHAKPGPTAAPASAPKTSASPSSTPHPSGPPSASPTPLVQPPNTIP